MSQATPLARSIGDDAHLTIEDEEEAVAVLAFAHNHLVHYRRAAFDKWRHGRKQLVGKAFEQRRAAKGGGDPRRC